MRCSPPELGASQKLRGKRGGSRGEDQRRDDDAERLDDLQLDQHLELDPLLDRKIGRLGALEDLVLCAEAPLRVGIDAE